MRSHSTNRLAMPCRILRRRRGSTNTLHEGTMLFRAIVLFSLLNLPALADGPAKSVTHHTATFNGETVSYSATVERTILPDAAGKPAASLVTTAYVRDGIADEDSRPVMFIFNGGPGASSSPL